ncbi:uncharacterized protein LOC131956024 [Physella acuta]|uniref:uncharacterized protein LOC131956024 n=1 Tax=Physella acuta TaxID=109671 RepID=UPI0027DABC09|nr:uncharacterized protein LOC131956024 [Physella acuta]
MSSTVLINPEKAQNVGIRCRVHFPDCKVDDRDIFEHWMAFELKERLLFSYPNLDPYNYDVIIRFHDESQNVIPDETELNAEDLKRCEGIYIVIRGQDGNREATPIGNIHPR